MSPRIFLDEAISFFFPPQTAGPKFGRFCNVMTLSDDSNMTSNAVCGLSSIFTPYFLRSPPSPPSLPPSILLHSMA